MPVSEAEKLRRELSKVSKRRGPCFPPDLKKRVSGWLAERRVAGAPVAELAAELGLARGTILRWSAGAPEKQTRALVPVEVVAERTLSVSSPSGFRIDGLSFTEAVALLRALG
jgi:hypothetical protein